MPAEPRLPLKEAVFSFCYESGIRTLLEFAKRAGMGITTLHAALERGSASGPTLEKIAGVMKRRPEELIALRDPNRHRSPRRLASLLFNVAVRDGRQPDVDAIVLRVKQDLPAVEEERIRRYVEAREKKRRGPGAPRSYTDHEALEVQRLRDDDGLSWAEIGQRMGWPVIKNARGYATDCRRARNAYAFAETLALV